MCIITYKYILYIYAKRTTRFVENNNITETRRRNGYFDVHNCILVLVLFCFFFLPPVLRVKKFDRI